MTFSRSIYLKYGFVILLLLPSLYAKSAKACTKNDFQWIELKVSTFDLTRLCENQSLGCQILEDFDHFFPLLYDTLGDSVTLIIPMEEVTRRMRPLPRTFGITHTGLPWSHWASVIRVNEGELRAVNTHLLKDEWRGPEVKLLQFDRIKVPNNLFSLSRLGPIKFYCESAEPEDK